jgi:hypothetical protein
MESDTSVILRIRIVETIGSCNGDIRFQGFFIDNAITVLGSYTFINMDRVATHRFKEEKISLNSFPVIPIGKKSFIRMSHFFIYKYNEHFVKQMAASLEHV